LAGSAITYFFTPILKQTSQAPVKPSPSPTYIPPPFLESALPIKLYDPSINSVTLQYDLQTVLQKIQQSGNDSLQLVTSLNQTNTSLPLFTVNPNTPIFLKAGSEITPAKLTDLKEGQDIQLVVIKKLRTNTWQTLKLNILTQPQEATPQASLEPANE
jgi:hypothetical protein